ncbi:MAG: hypothetical protein JWL59_2225 [Chthoniobacteraceae bacterium]|nr:hypothetical protein [Chthoniobacteraceae bacterium]
MKTVIPGGGILSLFVAGSLLCASLAHATMITISMAGGEFRTETGSALGTGAMLQLVNLGANGVFDSIGLASWIGGDDSVVNLPFASGIPNVDGYASAGSFDLTDGVGTAGTLDRVFNFDFDVNLNPGDKLGIRWFPHIAASNSYGSTAPAPGSFYGQFTRQGMSLYGDAEWIVPEAGSAVIFDSLITTAFGGSDFNNIGVASFQTPGASTSVPEAGSLLPIFAATFAALCWYRRRMAQ